MISNRALSLVPFVLLSAITACTSPEATDANRTETVAKTSQRVINGTASDASQDAVVLLVHYDPAARQASTCTGTLIAPNLVLTARHCVAATDEGAACDAEGNPIAEGVVRTTFKPETLYVFKGAKRPELGPKIKSDAVGAQILDDGGTNLCNHDIALVLLNQPVADAQIASLRLQGEINAGETITAIGWGYTEKGEPQTRMQRTDVAVTNVGPDANALPPVSPNEFEVGESICSGDSGGPAISTDTGAIIGVVSRGGNGAYPGDNPAVGCIKARNLYTKVQPFADFIKKGFELAEAEPWLEGGPDPRLLKPGSACTDGAECRSNMCLTDSSQGGATTCAEDCTQTSTCSIAGEQCGASGNGDTKVCRAPVDNGSTTTTSGCATAPGGSTSNTLFAGLLAAFGLLALRRRRS